MGAVIRDSECSVYISQAVHFRSQITCVPNNTVPKRMTIVHTLSVKVYVHELLVLARLFPVTDIIRGS
jgi:hypothetical protein